MFSLRAPQNHNTTTAPLQIAEAKLKAAGLNHLDIRYKNWVRAQKQYYATKKERDNLENELKPLWAKYEKAENDSGFIEIARSIEKLQDKLLLLNDAITKSIGDEHLQEEADADFEVLKAIKEVWTLKGSPL